jgi:hypothetical protein
MSTFRRLAVVAAAFAFLLAMAIPANATVLPGSYVSAPHFSSHNRLIKYEVQLEQLGIGMRTDAAVSCWNGSNPRQAYRCSNVIGGEVTLYKDGVEWGATMSCGYDQFETCGLPKQTGYTFLVEACGTHTWQGRLRTESVGSYDVLSDLEVDILTPVKSWTVAC